MSCGSPLARGTLRRSGRRLEKGGSGSFEAERREELGGGGTGVELAALGPADELVEDSGRVPADPTVSSTGGRQEVWGPRSSIWFSSRTVSRPPSRSALLTANTSPISSSPAFPAWMLSPHFGVTTTTVVSAACITSTSDWPTPTVSTST